MVKWRTLCSPYPRFIFLLFRVPFILAYFTKLYCIIYFLKYCIEGYFLDYNISCLLKIGWWCFCLWLTALSQWPEFFLLSSILLLKPKGPSSWKCKNKKRSTCTQWFCIFLFGWYKVSYKTYKHMFRYFHLGLLSTWDVNNNLMSLNVVSYRPDILDFNPVCVNNSALNNNKQT